MSVDHYNRALTPKQKLHAAFLHHIVKIDQQMLTHVFLCNVGRINEACKNIEVAMHHKVRQYHDKLDKPSTGRRKAKKRVRT